MSFKRQGNDSNLLGILKKRRIKELLAEAIPEDEAKLLCNGRYTCVVCPNNPIFDTVAVLCVHRKGKKHLANQEVYEEKKREIERLVALRYEKERQSTQGNSYTMARNSSTEIVPSSSSGLFRKKGGQPKPRLHLSVGQAKSTQHYRNHSSWREICQHQQSQGPIKHEAQLARLFGLKQDESQSILPYRSRRTETAHRSEPYHNHPDISLGADLYSSKQTLTVGANAESCCKHECAPVVTCSSDLLCKISDKKQETKSCNLRQGAVTSSSNRHSKDFAQKTAQTKNLSAVAERYRLLQGSGWKKDWDGKWIKDEEAEFDSDEEPPDIP